MAQFKSHTKEVQQKRDYRSASQGVGFHVSLSTTTALGEHQIVVFDTIVTNYGNGYDSRHGHFTAPVSGLYAFAITILSNKNESSIHAAIIRDGHIVGVAFGNGYEYDSATKLVVLRLQAGQMVWVEHYLDRPGYQLYGNNESTFSGFLISAY
ncbi:complement C1q-like protein 4 [Argopecten irradians]|uniref:complement C1q-like protein 4 n=1 Tax=Argopecten irradians TaxID=31199 RepID=UPI003710749A